MEHLYIYVTVFLLAAVIVCAVLLVRDKLRRKREKAAEKARVAAEREKKDGE